MAMPPSTGGVTTIDCLKDDNVDEILLHLPSSVSLTRAACACTRWRRIASNPDFLRRFRRRHPTAHLLGLFASQEYGNGSTGLPVFHLAGPVRSDPDLVAVARRGDFLLTRLEDDRDWRLRDCRDGLLLLSRDRSLSIYDPISLRCTNVRRPRDNIYPDAYVTDCLLRGDGGAFRVVSMQQIHSRKRRVVEYDSSTLEWRFHPWWTGDIMHILPRRAMYAAGLIFWDYHKGCLLQLDTITMEFSVLLLPASLTSPDASGYSVRSSYAVGETAYGACCLACDVGGTFQVWVLTEDCGGGGGRTWELEKQVDVSRLVIRGPGPGYYISCEVRVISVAAGVVVVNVQSSVDEYNGQLAIDLMDLSTKAKFLCKELGTYPMQLPWPPLGLAPAAYTNCNQKNRKKTCEPEESDSKDLKQLVKNFRLDLLLPATKIERQSSTQPRHLPP